MRRIYFVISLYIISILSLFIYKPAMLFDCNGELKYFDYDDTHDKATVFSMELVLGVLAVFCYLIVLSLELVFNN